MSLEKKLSSPSAPLSPIASDIRATFGNFTPDPYTVITDSAHGVMIGTVQPYGDVAVKPHANFEHAIHEARNLGTIAALGFNTFTPLTVARSNDGKGYLVTARERDLTNLGEIDWHTDVASPRLASTVDPALDVAGAIAASMHNQGITYGDFQPKNVMLNREGRHIFGDAEKTQFNQKGDVLARQADTDIFKFGAQTLVRGLLRDKSPSYRAGYLGDKFIGPYMDEVSKDKFTGDQEARRVALEKRWQKRITELNKRQAVRARQQGRF